MSKNFLKMMNAQRTAEAKKWERGLSFDETRPLSSKGTALWQMAKRGRGRPPKPEEEKAVRFPVSMDPQLFAVAEAFAASNGIDRSKLFALSVQAFIAADSAHREALSGKRRNVDERVRSSRRRAAKK